MSLPPWDQQTFSFGWDPYVHTIQQCSTLKIAFSNDLGSPSIHANPAPAPPYTVIIYQGGYQPLTLAVGNMGQKGTYNWVVNLPMGPMYMLAMKDSAGYTGGVSLRWSMTAGSGCALSPPPMSPSSLSFTRSGISQCGQVNYVVNNGTSPFQVEIIPEVRQQRTLHFATNEFGFVLDLPAGLYFFIAITDAGGNSGVDGMLTVGSSNDNSCLNVAATLSVGMATSMYSGSGIVLPSPTSTTESLSSSTTSQEATSTGVEGSQLASPNTPVIAGAVAGVAAAVLFFLLAVFCLRRRKKRRLNPTVAGTTEEETPKFEGNDRAIYVPQYPSAAVPEIYTEEPHTRVMGYPAEPFSLPPGPGRSSNDSYTHSAYYNNVTTHAPHPQSYLPGRPVAFNNTPSTNQQTPTTDRFSQSTGMRTSLHPSSGDSGTDLNVPQNIIRFGDRKEGVTSPGLPPGAMPPSPTPGIGPVDFNIPLHLNSPGTPGSSNVHSWLRSPPPRSETGTVLPPYNEV